MPAPRCAVKDDLARKDPRVHRFYEQCGFVPRLRVGYAAQRPDQLRIA